MEKSINNREIWISLFYYSSFQSVQTSRKVLQYNELGVRGNLYKTLPANSNFDDITTNGFYNYNSIITFSGIPSDLVGNNSAFVLIVQEYDSMGRHQILLLTDSKGIYTRYRRSSGEWMAWVKQN